MKRIVLLRPAREDIDKAYDFYEEQAEGLGQQFVSSIFQEIGSLGGKHGFHSRQFGYHKIIADIFPFGIYYEITGDMISVVAVLDLRARPSTIRREIKGCRSFE